MNKEYYKSCLRKILRPAIHRKCPELLRRMPSILHDNATPHKAAIIKAVFEEYHCEVLKLPSYSPDLSPSDYDLFPKLKEPLRGIRYDDLNELYRVVNAVVGDISVAQQQVLRNYHGDGSQQLNQWAIILRECKHKNVSTFDHILEIKQLSLFIR